jgi:uncharacterized protein
MKYMIEKLMIKKITEKDIEKLKQTLHNLGDEVMDIETLDGFFCALACSPEILMPSDYLTFIFGGDLDFEQASEAEDVLGRVFSFFNAVSTKLENKTKTQKGIYLPFYLHESENNCIAGTLWARGFMQAVYLQPQIWESLLKDEQTSHYLLPMILLVGQDNPDPHLKTKPIADNIVPKIIPLMMTSLHAIYDFFKEERRKLPRKPSVRSIYSLGRNDPCHCGSEKKFKKCCLHNTPEITH